MNCLRSVASSLFCFGPSGSSSSNASGTASRPGSASRNDGQHPAVSPEYASASRHVAGSPTIEASVRKSLDQMQRQQHASAVLDEAVNIIRNTLGATATVIQLELAARDAFDFGTARKVTANMFADPRDAAHVGLLDGKAFLAVKEPFAKYIESDEQVCAQKLHLHFLYLNQLLETSGACNVRYYDTHNELVAALRYTLPGGGEDAVAGKAYMDRLQALWGPEAAERYQQAVDIIYADIEKHQVLDDSTVSVELLAISPAHQGKGIGKQLMSEFEDAMRQHESGIKSIALWTETSPEFYEKLGFKVVAKGTVGDKSQTGFDYFIMKKLLE